TDRRGSFARAGDEGLLFWGEIEGHRRAAVYKPITRWVLGKLLKQRPQPFGSSRQLLRQDPHLSDHGHEIRVAIPARHEVNVEVIDDARAGGSPQVHAYVDALRGERLRQHLL